MPYKNPEDAKAYAKRRYKANREEMLKKSNEYRLAHKEEMKNYLSDWQAAHPDKTKVYLDRYYLKKTYGLTIEQYEEMNSKQGGKCALCDKKETALSRSGVRRLSVDHDHKTGQIRGLLCMSCNTSIGKLGDNIEGLKKAIEYLERKRT